MYVLVVWSINHSEHYFTENYLCYMYYIYKHGALLMSPRAYIMFDIIQILIAFVIF